MDTDPSPSTSAPRRVALIAFDEASARGALPFARRLGGEGALLTLVVAIEGEGAGAAVTPPDWASTLAASEDLPVSCSANLGETIEQLSRGGSSPIVLIAVPAGALHVERLQRAIGSPPCHVALLFNADRVRPIARVLMATNTFAPLSRDATEMSYRLVPGGDHVHADFLRLVREGEGSEGLREKLLARIAERQPAFAYDAIVEPARSFERGVLHTLDTREPYDLVVIDAPRQGIIGRLSERVIPFRLIREDTPLLVYAAPSSPRARAFMRAWNLLYRRVPATPEQERIEVYAHVRRDSRAGGDFNILLSLSVVIAAFGLLLGSPAVVIGAMVVAPLMQPVIGIGLGVATANGPLTRMAAGSLGRGIVLGLVLSFAIGALTPNASLTSELEARGQPTTLDLLIALASGAAGAYITGKKGVANSAAGVAIAVALVPPLATVGIGLALGEGSLAFGASLLFATNVAAIAAMSSIMFLWMGFKPDRDRFRGLRGLAQGMATLLLLVAVIGFFLVARRESGALRLDRRAFDSLEASLLELDPATRLQSVAVDDRGSIVIVSAVVETADLADLAAQAPLAAAAVTEDLGRPALVRFAPAEGD